MMKIGFLALSLTALLATQITILRMRLDIRPLFYYGRWRQRVNYE
jgi:hypothetical protein